jgi:predicted DNA-binding protein (MmcQ/YjbR family)
MNIETIRSVCTSLPHVTEDVKWGNDLCFSIGSKMFCVASLQVPLTISFKVTQEEFEQLSSTNGIIPAPYVARYHWILVQDVSIFSNKIWEQYISQSYDLVKAKLPQKILNSFIQYKT